MIMDKKELVKKQQQASDKFNEIQKQRDQKTQELQELEDELKRLQGEYRAYGQLIEPDEALTIKAEEKPDGKKSKS